MAKTLFYSSLMTETNTFSVLETDYASFEAEGVLRGDDILYDSEGEPKPSSKKFLESVEAHGFRIIAGLTASAAPGAPVRHEDYLHLRDEILQNLEAVLPVDIVFLHLHGAMVSTECLDCEGDILSAVRAAVGATVPIGAVLDPHAHLTKTMLDNADIMAFMKEYPHVDGEACTDNVLEVLFAMERGTCRPIWAMCDCQLIGFFPTSDQPMRGFVDSMKSLQSSDDVLSISFVHGFPWGDTPDTGAKVIVYTNSDSSRAQLFADEYSNRLWSIKGRTMPEMISVEESVRIMRSGTNTQGPIVFSDIADNPGGGAPSDSTFILEAAIDAGVEKLAIGLMVDPGAVVACHDAGVGSHLLLDIGGKNGPSSGRTLRLEVEVKALAKAAVMTVVEGVEFTLGDTAWIRSQGIDIVLASHREQMYAPSGFTHLGIDPRSYYFLVVKSSNHFRAFFSDLASEIHTVNTPGAIDFEFSRLPYQHCKVTNFTR